MIVANIIFSFIYAVVITAVFTLIFKKNGPWDGFWLLFILVFLASVGAGHWAAPAGPSAWGFHWLPGLVAAFIFALLVAAATPDPHQKKVDEQAEVNALAVNYFFILLIIILVILAIAGLIHYD